MSYVAPPDLVQKMIEAGQTKVGMSTRDTLLRAFMGAALLALGAVFAVSVTVQTGSPLLGALLFPACFCMIYLLGYDLLTGVFVLSPLALVDKRPGVTPRGVLRNWGLVFLGNFAGALLVAGLMAFVFTYGFSAPPGPVGEKIAGIGVARTLGYAKYGLAGWFTIFVRGMLCNWMVSTGVISSMMSTNVTGKVLGMWLPITVFFYMTFEHSIVNMFLFPSALMMHGAFSISDYFVWNEIPTILGNMVGGLLFTGATLYTTHARSDRRDARLESAAVRGASATSGSLG